MAKQNTTTYVISKYDNSDNLDKVGTWTEVVTVQGLALARKEVKALEQKGYDRDLSISVDVLESEWPADLRGHFLDIDIQTGKEK